MVYSETLYTTTELDCVEIKSRKEPLDNKERWMRFTASVAVKRRKAADPRPK